MSFEDLENSIKNAVKRFKSLEGKVKIVSHNDCDGICSASIMLKALKREDRIFSLKFVTVLSDEALKEISECDEPIIFITDLGSSNIESINKYLKNKQVFILDHHQISSIEELNNITHINPFLFELDGKDISGSGVTYLFTKYLNEENIENAYIAVTGAIADIQERNGFDGLNKIILEDALPKIEIKKGLRIFGYTSKPIHKVLMQSYDPFIPEVSGNELGAIKFLEQNDIKYRDKDKFRTISDLDENELKKLIEAIIISRLNTEKNPEDVIGNIYLVNNEEGIFSNLQEITSIINACGRLDKYFTGVGVLLNNKKSRKEALTIWDEYKQELIKSLEWIYSNKDKFTETDKIIIINVKNNIKENIISPISSLISRSIYYNKMLFILGYTKENKIKVSSRYRGNNEVNLKEILENVTNEYKLNLGGHKNAAGCILDIKDEERFISDLLNYFK